MIMFTVVTHDIENKVKQKHMLLARDKGEALRNAFKRHPQANKAWISDN